HVRWTYDPLRAANAGLNIARLGAEARTYYPDYYGDMAGINHGAPSDRLLADWHLASPQVAARAAGQAAPPLAGPTLRIGIPADFGALLAGDPVAAQAERLRVRGEMQEAFAKGYAVRGFDTARREYLLLRD
ncbi:MAG TPA: GNAT family N-acetyltransferase, partial [Paracoccaceae bacterium]